MDNNKKDDKKIKFKFFKIIFNKKNICLFGIGLIVFIGLIFVYSYKFKFADTNCFPEQIWLLLDPVSAIFTFLITIVILYNQANEKWKNSLEKRLDIDYIVSTNSDEKDKLIAEVKNAYLAGESDIRQWAQQLGMQMFGKLDFDMNWDDEKPIIKKDNKSREYYISNKITMYLTSNPLDTDAGKEKIDKFLKRNFKHSKISGNEKLPITWERIESSNNNKKKVRLFCT